MKKSLLFAILITFSFACSSDDDDQNTQEGLSGTHWVKTTNNERHFTFTSTTEYVYSEGGSSYPGTYIYDGSEGVMTETSSNFELDFKVEGNILSANQDTSDPDFEALYEKQ